MVYGWEQTWCVRAGLSERMELHSRVRKWAGLDQDTGRQQRYAFRRHYHVAPWTSCMELHWGNNCQLYVTPVAADEICVASISRDPHLRLDDALARFPAVADRLQGLERTSAERGAVSETRKLRQVFRGRTALIGDASGSVDAITGEGLCLAFRQAILLSESFAAGRLEPYQAKHRKLARRPAAMSWLMLTLDGRDLLTAASDASIRDSTADFRQDAGLACGRRTPSGAGGNRAFFGMGLADPVKTTTIATIAVLWLTGASLAQSRPHEIQLNFVPAKTTVNFTLGDVLHTVHGSFNLKRGAVDFDPATNRISGEILVEAASGNSGSSGRDKKNAE